MELVDKEKFYALHATFDYPWKLVTILAFWIGCFSWLVSQLAETVTRLPAQDFYEKLVDWQVLWAKAQLESRKTIFNIS